MKISKLFHWLYAFLMFLPIFFVLGKCLYVTFNKNAKESYYGETINENEILTPTSVNNSTKYLLYWSNLTNYTNSPAPRVYVNNFNIENMGNMSQQTYDTIMSFKDNIEGLVITNYNNAPNIQFVGNNVQAVNLTSGNWVFSFNYVGKLNTFDITNLRYIEYNKYSYLDNAIDYGMYQLNESNLFSWAKDSFLSTPITYITNLFNMPFDSPVITALSYWLNISIIWLTFDVIIYVPLLAHRWLDKGVRE